MTLNQSVAVSSFLELEAKKAQELVSFNKINLNGIKDVVSQALDLFGKNGLFSEYTVHNISHINKMLSIAEWIIPSETKARMSRADYLLIVLSIYFHDLGLIVTMDEFNNRDKSGFDRYLQDNLFFGKDGEDYKSEVFSDYPDEIEREKFLYQEFVRANHAKRIRKWIEGKFNAELGYSEKMFKEVDELMSVLPSRFRNDLALVCESHHLNDLDNLDKYIVSQPYGDSDDETGNIQYAAIILRTADLLHITTDRTPSVQFRLINPQNPKSQIEWVKQNAVTRIRPKKITVVDEKGNESEEQSEAIEVFADFSSADGYFGLTSYLTWAEKEIKQNKKWCESAKSKGGGNYIFPWSSIDQSRVNSEGFLKQQFSFSIDQEKILDLLTGHTLYNDPSVVVREIVQNSIDAIKLKNFIKGNSDYRKDYIRIEWDSDKRVLRIIDTGTGMSQQIIENHFLKAGSSRYHDREFKKNHPNFNSISRFGIGVLSCFMISDEVEVITSHSDDEQARHLLLRSVHGKYLISLLDKSTLSEMGIAESGTVITIKVRQSLGDFDVINIAKKWILFPVCKVEVSVDGEEADIVGYENTEKALLSYLDEIGIKAFVEGGEQISGYKIKTVQVGGLSLSYALKWSNYFKEWEFYKIDSWRNRQEIEYTPISTCIEGIRVESGTPGFVGYSIAAIANVTGSEAPKTNVARSGLESTGELIKLLRQIYSSYGGHITSEINNLVNEKNFSLTWAVAEAKWLLPPITEESHSRYRPIRQELLNEELKKIPLILVDIADKRENISIEQLNQYNSFWVIDWDFNSAVNNVLKNAPVSLSIKNIMKELSLESSEMPEEPILSDSQMQSNPYKFAFNGKQIDLIRFNVDLRRLDMRWSQHDPSESLWISQSIRSQARITDIFRGRERSSLSRTSSLKIANSNVIFIGDEKYHGVSSNGNYYIKPDSPIADILKSLIEIFNNTTDDDMLISSAVALSMCSKFIGGAFPVSIEIANRWMGEYYEDQMSEEVLRIILRLNDIDAVHVFDPSVWRREIKGVNGYVEDY
ncbi:ATP-binding protein [Deinococcus sp. JMULE3]|uniref:HD domain-containing protein n=1 Tax=Deinococcus sp. JMULE3 TaxID=2518341 RepID=UPI0015751AC2|nr:ATP-binding protein [Deinococcus sp. JMULE3]